MHGLSSRVKLILAAILLVIGLLKLVDWAAEYLWFEALGYDGVFWTIRGLKVAIFIAAFLLSLAYFWINFRMVRGIGVRLGVVLNRIFSSFRDFHNRGQSGPD